MKTKTLLSIVLFLLLVSAFVSAENETEGLDFSEGEADDFSAQTLEDNCNDGDANACSELVLDYGDEQNPQYDLERALGYATVGCANSQDPSLCSFVDAYYEEHGSQGNNDNTDTPAGQTPTTNNERITLNNDNSPVEPPQDNQDITVDERDYTYVGTVNEEHIYQDEVDGLYYAYDADEEHWRQVTNINDQENLPQTLEYTDQESATTRLNGNVDQRTTLSTARSQGIDFFLSQEGETSASAQRENDEQDYSEIEDVLGEELFERLEDDGVNMIQDEQGNYFGENDNGERIALGALGDETGHVMIIDHGDGTFEIARSSGEQLTRTSYVHGQEIFSTQQALDEEQETYQMRLGQGTSGTVYARENPFEQNNVQLFSSQQDAQENNDPIGRITQRDGKTTIDNTQKNERTVVRENGVVENYQGRYRNDDTNDFSARQVEVTYPDGTSATGNYNLRGEFQRMTFRNEQGTITGMCVTESCFQDPQSNERFNFRERDNRLEVCQGPADSCEAWVSASDEECQQSNGCSDAVRRVRTQRFFNYEGDAWDIARGQTDVQQTIGSVLEFRPGWETLSSWLFPDATARWNQNAVQAFNDLYPTDIITREVCDYRELHKTQEPGSTSLFIQTPSGLLTNVGSITAERSREQVPISCSEEFTCAEDQECREDGLCYQNDEPVLGHFYKITWGVRASPDNPTTDVQREGSAMRFNVGVTRGGQIASYLYEVAGSASANTLSLTRGQSDGGVYATYSSADPAYSQACIIISEGKPRDLHGNSISEICADFIPSSVGESQWRRANDGQRVANVRTSDESVNQRQI